MLLGKAKIAEVVISNVEVPKIAIIQSVNRSPRYSEAGEAIQGSIAKISCQFVDAELAKLIQKSGADSSELKTYPLELIGNEQDLLGISVDELLGSEIKLEGAKVMLKWEQGGRNSGGWKSLKLALNVSETTNESEKK
ncbi:hypothetical protein MOZ20_000233 [Listeria monocytogenes]|uniref:hypothetical protein n=1 Tax=Listeria innocua TaxID=1642 RepID=UPI00226D7568|nr:hypothetical protein [Listeria innocua]EIZ2536031.1 hypothetical protein [Listeria monocytogenes]